MLSLYYPGRMFMSVSVTGRNCQLMCSHCKGRFLRHMKPAKSPDKLLAIAKNLDNEGGIGMLVSGGSDETGKVPLDDYYDALARIKDETNLILNLHTGVIGPPDIDKLADLKPHIISLDVVGSPEAVKNVYGLDVPLSRYEDMLVGLIGAGLNVVPHVTVGLDSGRDSGATAALEMIARHRPKMAIINALMGDRDSRPGAEMLAAAVDLASDTMPETLLGIGCMRPRNIDIPMGLMEKIDALAMPSKSRKFMLKKFRIAYEEKDGCCALASL